MKNELMTCPICLLAWMLAHPQLLKHKKCTTCGFTYKVGEEDKAIEQAKAVKLRKESYGQKDQNG